MASLVIEHIFITTMEPAEAIAASAQMLAPHKFVAAGRQGFAINDAVPATAEFVRAKRSRFMRLSNRNSLDRAQKVRLDFDRGRVTVAVAMDDANATDLSITRGDGIFGRKRRRRLRELQEAYLVGIAKALDARLARRDADDVASQHFTAPAAEIQTMARRATRNAVIILAIFFVVIAVIIGVGIYSSSRH